MHRLALSLIARGRYDDARTITCLAPRFHRPGPTSKPDAVMGAAIAVTVTPRAALSAPELPRPPPGGCDSGGGRGSPLIGVTVSSSGTAPMGGAAKSAAPPPVLRGRKDADMREGWVGRRR